MSTYDLQNDYRLDQSPQKKRGRDADLLILLSSILKARENEIGRLLDLALSALSSASNFPERADLERALQKARSLVRTLP
jgi:hypothetical protein